jgi:hypothetical protein
MLPGACTISNAAPREVGCKAANGSGEGCRDIRRGVLQPATISVHQVMISSKFSAATAAMVAIVKMSGKPKILGARSALGQDD